MTKTTIVLSLIAAIAFTMFLSQSAMAGLPGFADIKEAEVDDDEFEAELAGDFEDCPSSMVCGVGVFETNPPAAFAAAMVAATIHDFFCDHADQDPSCIPGGLIPVPPGGDDDVPHVHELFFVPDDICVGVNPFGVKLAGENDLDGAEVDVDDNEVEVENIPDSISLDSTVHTFTVEVFPDPAIPDGVIICPVILDSLDGE